MSEGAISGCLGMVALLAIALALGMLVWPGPSGMQDIIDSPFRSDGLEAYRDWNGRDPIEIQGHLFLPRQIEGQRIETPPIGDGCIKRGGRRYIRTTLYVPKTNYSGAGCIFLADYEAVVATNSSSTNLRNLDGQMRSFDGPPICQGCRRRYPWEQAAETGDGEGYLVEIGNSSVGMGSGFTCAVREFRAEPRPALCLVPDGAPPN